MGLANLVPGISGGTMLLATGVYRSFVDAVAQVTSFRWNAGGFFTLALIGGGAVVAILAGAGLIAELVQTSRWATFSVFIGLTLGGIPLLRRLVGRWQPASVIGCILGMAAMAALAFAPPAGAAGASSIALLALAGALGGAAMVLPGLSGAYLLLILGQYVAVLGAIEAAKSGDVATAAQVLVPVGIGAAVGVVGISNFMRWLLQRHPVPTHGFLLGLLAGAVLGLWPFMMPQPPKAGDIIRGEVVTQTQVDSNAIEMKHWPLAAFTPTGGQAFGAIALILVGFGASAAIGRMGEAKPRR